ncbi:DUF3047 domain-containing protein [Ramlibacter rhizophilus]|uniref:DUF3047 domain-containing protein n=1 Tax=Ramlibacter rhizophilus TaxID=1781167 RepID=A0A4Z0BP14_9BURK|nr:DUF3047 domain-containing protein [Ramlibacter rhizophilus]TFZ01053.1 DUF3047 domain-containing protein [Ramlibacter rhizophilus]
MNRRHALASVTLASIGWRASHAQAAWDPPPFSGAPLGPGIPPGWVHETLPRVERANDYAVVLQEGERVLQVTSRSSASSLLASARLPPGGDARLRWRWKVSHALPASDLRHKPGDDWSARLYVLFDLPLERLGLGERLAIGAARALSGRPVPAAALCYVWGQAQPAGTTGWNPFTDRVRMVVLDSGDRHAGQWRLHERNLRRDWAEAFPGEMPHVAAVAVGSDTDNSGGEVQAWFGDVSWG